MHKVLLVFTYLVVVGGCTATPTALHQPEWLVGTWELTEDPDGTPTDWMQFLPDGTFVNTLSNCQEFKGKYHVFDGDLYFAIEPDAKFLANGMRPTSDRRKLLYTSPRTRNTATYEKVERARCKG
jgi:hypothetical protein